MKNTQSKTRKVDQPYETWKSFDGSWEWRVLKKWQADDDKPYSRWFCAVKSPFTYDSWEYGDVYVSEIKSNAIQVFKETTEALQPRKAPSIAKLEKWLDAGYCLTPDGCKVEPDGTCLHGEESWARKLGII